MEPSQYSAEMKLPQVPTGDQVFLDHVGFFTNSQADLSAELSAFGFNVSQVNRQYNSDQDGRMRRAGTSNRLSRFKAGFIEILFADSDTALSRELQDATNRHDGLHLIAFSSENLQKKRSQLLEHSFKMAPVVKLERATSDGTVRWSVLRFEKSTMPEGRIQFAYPHTPKLSWPETELIHKNGVQSLTSVNIITNDKMETLDRYARFTGRHAKQDVLELDRGCIAVSSSQDDRTIYRDWVAPDAPCIASATFATRNIEQLRNVLRRQNVPFFDQGDMVWAGPLAYAKTFIGFHAEGIDIVGYWKSGK